jgi:hypothetical protein
MIKVLVASFLMSAAMVATAHEKPPSRFESWGVCPFECCTYREWTADADVPVHQQRSDRSAVLFHLSSGEPFDALTGVVVTENPALVTIDHPLRDGYVAGDNQPQLSFKEGDVIYKLAPLGEGAFRFWYHGKVYDSGTDLAGMPGVEGKGVTLTWWKQVRNKAGKTGWTRSDRFRNADACG